MRNTWPFAAVVFKALCITFVSSPPKPALPRFSRFTDGELEMDVGGAPGDEEPGAEEPGAEEAGVEPVGDELNGFGFSDAAGLPPQPYAAIARTKKRPSKEGGRTRELRQHLAWEPR